MIEVIVTEGKMLKMGEFKEGTVGREGAIEAAAAEVEYGDMAGLLVAADAVPRTAVSAISPP